MNGLPPDVRSLWYDMKNQEKEIRRKRQWLMSSSAPVSSSRKRLKSKESIMPETMLREDDLFYESLKKHVEKGFGVCHEATELPTTHDVEPFVQHKMIKTILALLDDFTNNGLYILAKVIAGSSVVFEKTRWKMKKFIKENLPKVLGKQSSSIDKEVEVYNKLSQVLKDPYNFQKNNFMLSTVTSNMNIHPTVQSHYDATQIVLNELKDMSLQTLCAMYRRLKGAKGSLPVLNPSRTGWSKSRLASRVKSLSLEMLSKLGILDELPLPLIKAMEVASLSLKLSSHQDAPIINFCNYSPKIESLQNEIVKAISLLKCKVGVHELKGLREFLDPGSDYEVLNGGLRKSIRKMLTEFLFECSDMDEIPIILLDTLAVINGCPLRLKEVTEEVESILSVSAQVKQVLWDSLDDHELDLDFSDAYTEDIEESDDGELSDDQEEEEELATSNLDDESEVGSTADSHGVYCTPIWNVSNMSTAKSESECKTEIKVEPDDFQFTPSTGLSKSFDHTASMDSKHMADTKDFVSPFPLSSSQTDQIKGRKLFESSCKVESADFVEDRNKYLAIQQACDEASLIAYRFVGRVLEGYARIEEVDLDQRQISYLNDGNLFAVDLQDRAPNEDQATPSDDVDDSIIIQTVRELIPSFSDSELEKVRKILR